MVLARGIFRTSWHKDLKDRERGGEGPGAVGYVLTRMSADAGEP